MDSITMGQVATAARWLVGFVLLTAGLRKISSLNAFAKSIQEYEFVPDTLSSSIARCLVGLELVLGFALVLGIAVRATSLASAGLLGLFIGVISWNLAHGQSVTCVCFGNGVSAGTGLEVVLRDTVLFAFAIASAWLPGGLVLIGPTRSALPANVSPAVDALAVALTDIGIIVVYIIGVSFVRALRLGSDQVGAD